MTLFAAGPREFSADRDFQIRINRTPAVGGDNPLSVIAVFKVPTSEQNANRLARFGRDHGLNRLLVLNSADGIEDLPTDEAQDMARAFFSQPLHAREIAFAGFYETSQPFLMQGDVLDENIFTTLNAIDDGRVRVPVIIDGTRVNFDLTGLNFTNASDLNGCVQALNTAIQAQTSVNSKAANLRFIISGTGRAEGSGIDNRLVLTSSPASDDYAPLFFEELPGDGEQLYQTLKMSVDSTPRITPAFIVDPDDKSDIAQKNFDAIRQSALSRDHNAYGWCLGRSLRDPDYQVALSSFVSQHRGLAFLVSNEPALLSGQGGGGTDISTRIMSGGYTRSVLIYNPVAAEYPDVAAAAVALSVDYSRENSAITLKFKDLVGITPINISEDVLDRIEERNYNVLAVVGGARGIRQGESARDNLFIDNIIGIDALYNDIQSELVNLFNRVGKVPYTTGGMTQIQAAMENACRRFVFNGFLAPRPVVDTTRQGGERLAPAFEITYTPLRLISVAQRGSRMGPPFTIVVRPSGAVHDVSIVIDVLA